MIATQPVARDPRREAAEIVGHEFVTHVLEPSPPAVNDGEWYADDPLAPRGVPSLLPDGIERAGSTSWGAWLRSDEHAEHAEWVAQRWLGGARSLDPPPSGIVETRRSLHRLAAYVIAPVRHAANGKFGLRWTLGGFGTPFFGDNRQIRVDGTTLIDQRAGQVRAEPITSLRAAAEFLDTTVDPDTAAEHDSPDVGDVDADLAIAPDAAAFLGNWYGMSFAALERLRASSGSLEPSRPQLWPGHFDPAIELGDEDHRASYGASPGDDAIPLPYLYVSIWYPERIGIDAEDPAWNASAFTGAVLELADFGTGDPVDVAAAFFAGARDRITA